MNLFTTTAAQNIVTVRCPPHPAGAEAGGRDDAGAGRGVEPGAALQLLVPVPGHHNPT